MPNDIPSARRDTIAGRLQQGHAVVAATLATEFEVSEDAIRRDLRALAAEGVCRRVYGGALPIAGGATPMAVRIDEGRERKEALARAAAATIQADELVFIDSGSTNLALVRFLPEDHGLTVATNSPDIGAALLRRPDLRLVMIGGAVDPVTGGCVDASAIAAIDQLNLDRSFIGACAVSAAGGVSAFELADAAFKRRVLAASATSLVLATSDKLGMRAPHRVAPIERIARVVIEHDAPADQVDMLARAGSSIVRADRP